MKGTMIAARIVVNFMDFWFGFRFLLCLRYFDKSFGSDGLLFLESRRGSFILRNTSQVSVLVALPQTKYKKCNILIDLRFFKFPFLIRAVRQRDQNPESGATML